MGSSTNETSMRLELLELLGVLGILLELLELLGILLGILPDVLGFTGI